MLELLLIVEEDTLLKLTPELLIVELLITLVPIIEPGSKVELLIVLLFTPERVVVEFVICELPTVVDTTLLFVITELLVIVEVAILLFVVVELLNTEPIIVASLIYANVVDE